MKGALLLCAATMLAASFAGCGVESTEPSPATTIPTAEPTTATPVPIPTATPLQGLEDARVELARDPAEALSDEVLLQGYRYFVLDLASGRIQPIGPATVLTFNEPIAWIDDDTLVLAYPGKHLELDLDGAVRSEPPAYATPEVVGRGGASPTGNWRVGQLASGTGGVIFSLRDAPPRYRIPNATIGMWAPTRDVHLLEGNGCAGWDLFVFDPDAETLTNVTAADDRPYRFFYAWALDGVRVAATASNDLALINTVTGRIETLLEGGDIAHLRPVAFSPSGGRLLVHVGFPPIVDCSVPPYEDTYLDTVPNLGGP